MVNFYERFKSYHEDFLKDLQGLLRIPSVLTEFNPTSSKPFGEGIHQALMYMLDIAQRDHFTVKNVDNYAGHIEVGEGEEILGILCHLDVVPTGDGWKYDPFSATIDNGKIYARGALDDKGPTMVAYYALKILVDMNVKFNKRIRIILGTDEESGWRGLNYYLTKEPMPDLGFAPDANFPLIYGEKGILEGIFSGTCKENGLYKLAFGERTNVVPDKAMAIVDVKYKDAYLEYLKKTNNKGEVKNIDEKVCELIAYGKNAHAMEPDLGLNAGFVLLTFLNEHLDNQFIQFACKYLTFDSRMHKTDLNYRNEEMGDLTCNVGVGNYENGHFQLHLNFRYPIHTDVLGMTEILKQKASEFGFEYNVVKDSKPHYVDPNSDLVRTLHQAYIKYTNDTITPLMTIGGGTYARAMKNAVAFGPEFPNKEALIHQPNEYAELEDLYKACAIYAEAIYNLTR
ncbi:MAG TPA: dipeptidase PepV [Haloplasmataceae bacterium]